MGRSSLRTVTLSTRGRLPLAKAPSPREDQTKGTQRTRKLSTGSHRTVELKKWEGTLRGAIRPRRRTEGVEPDAVKAASPVLNGGREEMCSNATRLAPTQQRLEIASAHSSLRLFPAPDAWR
jgi:hypothetical protein